MGTGNSNGHVAIHATILLLGNVMPYATIQFNSFIFFAQKEVMLPSNYIEICGVGNSKLHCSMETLVIES